MPVRVELEMKKNVIGYYKFADKKSSASFIVVFFSGEAFGIFIISMYVPWSCCFFFCSADHRFHSCRCRVSFGLLCGGFRCCGGNVDEPERE